MEFNLTYSPNSSKIRQLVLAGALATLISLMLNYLLDATGVFPIDFGMLYGNLFSSGIDFPNRYNGAWWAGTLIHLCLAILILPIAYDFLTHNKILPNRPSVKGLLFGAGVWLLIELLVKPFTIQGLFSYHMEAPVVFSLGYFISWLVYGLCLEKLTGVKMIHQAVATEEDRRAA